MNRASSLRSLEAPIPCSLSSRSRVSVAAAMAIPPVDLPSRRCRRELLRRVLHRLDDVLVARAAAEIARHPIADLLFRRIRILLEQPVRARDHARRAVAALQ